MSAPHDEVMQECYECGNLVNTDEHNTCPHCGAGEETDNDTE